MLPTCTTNFAKVSRTTKKVEHALEQMHVSGAIYAKFTIQCATKNKLKEC
jgi:hypothetical protein